MQQPNAGSPRAPSSLGRVDPTQDISAAGFARSVKDNDPLVEAGGFKFGVQSALWLFAGVVTGALIFGGKKSCK